MSWTICPMCEDWWCTQHELHTGDCPCPELESWAELDLDPYEHDWPEEDEEEAKGTQG